MHNWLSICITDSAYAIFSEKGYNWNGLLGNFPSAHHPYYKYKSSELFNILFHIMFNNMCKWRTKGTHMRGWNWKLNNSSLCAQWSRHFGDLFYSVQHSGLAAGYRVTGQFCVGIYCNMTAEKRGLVLSLFNLASLPYANIAVRGL